MLETENARSSKTKLDRDVLPQQEYQRQVEIEFTYEILVHWAKKKSTSTSLIYEKKYAPLSGNGTFPSQM